MPVLVNALGRVAHILRINWRQLAVRRILASWAHATAATAARSIRRLIRLVGPPRAIILSIRAALSCGRGGVAM